MERVYLEFREGTSDKFYRIIAMEVQGTWITTAWWGRRGSDGQTQIKYQGDSQSRAVACMHDFADQKRAKGYIDALDPLTPAVSSAPAPKIHPPVVIHASTNLPAYVPAAPNPNLASFTVAGVPRFPAMKAKEQDVDWTQLADFVMEEKFDGHRAGLTFNPDGTIVVRNVYGEDKGRIENMPHIEAHLRALAAMKHADGIYDGTLIDGELVGLTLAETTHLLGAGGKTDPRLRFVAFDLPFLNGEDLRNTSYRYRRGRLDNLLDGIPQEPVGLAKILPPDKTYVQEIWDRGGEGAILKPIESKYVPGGRADWIKIKNVHTADAVITGWVPGNGKYNNQLGAVVLSQYRGGVLTEVTKVSGMTDAIRLHMSKNWSIWENQVIEFEYQSKTPTGSYRHPRFVRVRNDKQATDCTWEASA